MSTPASITTHHAPTVVPVHLDPVTGAVLPAHTPGAPCCHSTTKPSTIITHPASDLYQTTLKALGLTLALSALSYTLYRYYQHYSNTHPSSSSPASPYPASSSSSAPVSSSARLTPYPTRTVHDEADFDHVLAEVAASVSPTQHVYVLVEGTHDPSTGLSWCPDCQQADPLLDRVLTEWQKEVVLLRAPVARAAYKGNALHPYRQHPQLQLQRIPTLYHMKNGRVVGQLIETELHDIDKIRKFVQQQQKL